MNDVLEDQYGSPVNFMKEGLKAGLVNGAIALVLLFGSYYINFNTFVDTQLYTGFVPYMMIILILWGFRIRKQNGNYLAFKEGLQFGMTAYLVSILLIAMATYILFNMIDPSLTEKMFKVGLEKTRHMMERLGAPQEQIDEAMDKASKSKNATGFKNIFLGIGQDLIWAFVKSLIIALIIRREKPQSAI